MAPGWRGRARLRLVVGVVSAALLVLFLYLELLGALGPEVQFDGRWYHLAQVKHYLQRGCLYNMVAETRISMVGLPAYHQLLLTGVATLFDLRAAKLFPWFEGLLAVLVMICICRHHFGSRLMGLVAALLFLSTPLVGWFTTTSANDLAVGLLSLLAIHVYLRWRAEPEVLSWLVLLGALGGFAAGVKPFALAFLLVLSLGVAVDGLRSGSAGGGARGRWRGMAVRLVTVGAVAVVAVTPWLVRSYMTTGSPTFPFLNGLVFHSPYWNEVVETYYRQAVKSYGVEQTLEWFLRLPVRTVTRANNHRGLIGPLFLVFLPVVAVTIVAARGAAGGLVRRLALYAALVVTLWFGSGLLEIRYVAFVIPALTLLVAFTLVEQSWPGRLGRLLRAILAVVALAVTVLNLQPFVPFQACGTIPGVAGAEPIPWDYLYRGASEESVYLGNLPMVAYVNRHLRPGFDKVYDATSTGSLVIFYLYSDIEVFNGEGWEGPRGLGQWSLGSPDAPWRLGQEGITHVVVHGVRWPRARLKGCAVGAFLHKVWTSPDGLVLYRFDRDAASSAAPGRRVGPDDSALSADGLESGAVRTSAGQ